MNSPIVNINANAKSKTRKQRKRLKELDAEIDFLQDYIKRMQTDCDCLSSGDISYLEKLKKERASLQ